MNARSFPIPARLQSFPRAAVFLAALLLLAGVPASRANDAVEHDGDVSSLLNGTWTAGRDTDSARWWMSLSIDDGRGTHHHSWGRMLGEDVEGLDLGALGSGRTPADFFLKRDAGRVHLHGEFSGVRGAGTFELELDPAFADALEKRGVGRPTKYQQARLLLGDGSFALLDALAREHYPTPRVATMMLMTDHGVREKTVTGFARAGYHLESLDALVTAVDHGVNPEFIREMAAAGYQGVEFDLLLRARDHGATGDYVADLVDAGFTHLPLEVVIRARDHGVDGGFVASLKRAGFVRVSLEDAIRARDHGVTSGYARHVREKQPEATLDQVIAMRDRGLRP